MWRHWASLVALAIVATLSGVAASRAEDVPQYNGPMFASPDKQEPPMPYWGVTLDSRFQPILRCERRENNHPTGSDPTTLAARFRYGSDEVAVYRGFLEDPILGRQDAYWVYTSQEATCRGIANGTIPLAK